MTTARSSAAAARNISGSPSVPASTCTPTGRPSAPVPNGTLMPGWPVRLAGIVYTSHRYIASGLSPFAPNGKATLGDVGVSSTSALLVGAVEVVGDQPADLQRLAVVGVVVAGRLSA